MSRLMDSTPSEATASEATASVAGSSEPSPSQSRLSHLAAPESSSPQRDIVPRREEIAENITVDLTTTQTTPQSGQVNEDQEDTLGSRKRSAIWGHFKEDVVNKKAKCNYCQKWYSSGSKNGTSSLWGHLSICKHKALKDRGQRQLTSSTSGSPSGEMMMYKFDQERSRGDIARFIIMTEQPFSIVEQPAFRTMIQNLRPEFKLCGRTTITKDCINIFRKEKEILKEIMFKSRGRVSLTTDTWTSLQTKCYMSITAHYIDDTWELQKKIINFIELDERHTGIILSMALSKCLSDWGIDEKLFSMTMDNLSTNNVVANLLRNEYKASLPLQGIFFHIRCSAHVLNLIVKEGLKNIDDSIVRIRDAVKFVTSSPQWLKIFNDLAKKMKVGDKGQRLDCVTRWNSTIEALICSQDWLRKDFSLPQKICLDEYDMDDGCDDFEEVID